MLAVSVPEALSSTLCSYTEQSFTPSTFRSAMHPRLILQVTCEARQILHNHKINITFVMPTEQAHFLECGAVCSSSGVGIGEDFDDGIASLDTESPTVLFLLN